jgi:ComF family protein
MSAIVGDRVMLAGMPSLRRAACDLVDLVFPPRCAACGRWGESDGRPLCAPCADAVSRERLALACPICASDVGAFAASWDGCGDCRDVRRRIGGTVRVGAYRATVGLMLRQYKYHHREDLEPLLAGWLTDSLSGVRWLERVEAVVSVPTHWRRAISRRFHAADALASAVARNLDLPHLPLLRRTRAGPHQIGLSVEDRRKNVRRAFSLRRGVKLRGARLLLIDDVRTTGATVEECAKVLRRGGAAEVYAGVIARANWPAADAMPRA